MGREIPKITHPKKRAFLACYKRTGNIRQSTAAAGVQRRTFYDWCEHDLVFSAAAQQAKEEYGDLLEQRLNELAFEDRNPTALIVALKMAGRFVEKSRQEVSGPEGQPIAVDVNDNRSALASRIASLTARAGAATMAERAN